MQVLENTKVKKESKIKEIVDKNIEHVDIIIKGA